MKEQFVSILSCTVCGSKVKLNAINYKDSGEIIDGILGCTSCRETFPVMNGIPVFLEKKDRVSHVAKSFGFEWQTHHDGGFESDTVFGRTLEEDIQYFFDAFGIGPKDLDGAFILDAGCGSGILTAELAIRYPKCTIVGLDFNPAIFEIFKKYGRLPNFNLVRASVFNVPFAEKTFHYVWSNGVIHHTGNTRSAFDSLSRTVKKGSMAYIWVYQKKLSPLVCLRMLLTPFGLKYWDHKFLYFFCQLISLPTWLAVTFASFLSGTEMAQLNTHMKILTRKRGYRELVLTWFDVLSPKYRDTYSRTELESWFIENGFENTKQYWYPVGVCGTRK